MTGVECVRYKNWVCAFLIVVLTPASYALTCTTKPMELAFDHSSQVFLGRILSSETTYSAVLDRSSRPRGFATNLQSLSHSKAI